MRKPHIFIFAIIAASLAAGGFACSQKPAEIKYSTYKSEPGKFEVTLPNRYMELTEKTESTDTDWGVKKVTTFQSPRVNFQFTVSVMDMEKTKFDDTAAAKRLAERRDKLARETGITEKDRGDATLDGNPALTLRFTKKIDGKEDFYEYRGAFMGNRLYELYVEATNEKRLDDPEIKKFFDSFKYTGENAQDM
jgi:hypothetical protein